MRLQAAVGDAEHLLRLGRDGTVLVKRLVTAHQRQRKALRRLFETSGGRFEAPRADARVTGPMDDAIAIGRERRKGGRQREVFGSGRSWCCRVY